MWRLILRITIRVAQIVQIVGIAGDFDHIIRLRRRVLADKADSDLEAVHRTLGHTVDKACHLFYIGTNLRAVLRYDSSTLL